MSAPFTQVDLSRQVRGQLPPGNASSLAAGAINYVIGDGVSTMNPGGKGYMPVPFRCMIVGWTLLGDVVGNIQLDLQRCNFAGFPTTASMIGSGNYPTLSTSQSDQETPTGWIDTQVQAGDILEFVVNSVSGIKRITLSLSIVKF